ncbi:helix-turn-helix domain-containing protein [Pseudomonas sp. NBRC 111139]|uniref:helix-turn-helix domain-containing protein n=1 Tax=Pseudomonas sp. NBRC 111139 TaxID=1661054 RepID=UPI0008635BA7|nr:helix-turn-helix domain-containing protein [Pseudomonas sp. NBRC 111139]
MTPDEEQLAKAFGSALKTIRLRRSLSRRQLSELVSGATYLVALERGDKQPTIGKLAEIAHHLEIHPLTLLMLAYLIKDGADPEQLMVRMRMDLTKFMIWPDAESEIG